MDLGINGRVALVTASSRGLGREVAERLADEGVRLAICARNEQELNGTANEIQRRTHVEVMARPCDLTDEQQVQGLVQEVLERWGRLDILVVNCGGPPPGLFLEHDTARWRQAVDLNLMSAVWLCRAAGPRMRQQGWGRIVLMTSISVKQPIEGLVLSNSVRAATTGLARTLANEWGADGVLVNTVCPGYFLTERVTSLADHLARQGGQTREEIIKNWGDKSVLGRVGDPAEFGSLVAFLCSERASYITGATLAIDGGWCRGLM
jgi:3-oxoacyl-[acyl-carrier protein] reductase